MTTKQAIEFLTGNFFTVKNNIVKTNLSTEHAPAHNPSPLRVHRDEPAEEFRAKVNSATPLRVSWLRTEPPLTTLKPVWVKNQFYEEMLF